MSSTSPTPTLSPLEARILGVLVEKALTTPAQYPLTLNSLTTGTNQKNNRHPVTNISEDDALAAVDALRAKGLVREAMLSGSRVAKYRHLAREVLEVDTPALVVLTELMLRGPQSLGEIRNNGSRMHPLESLEAVKAILDQLAARPHPLIAEYPPPPGGRARVFRQLLAPAAHPEPASGPAGSAGDDDDRSPAAASLGHASAAALATRVDQLESEVADLRSQLQRLATQLGATL